MKTQILRSLILIILLSIGTRAFAYDFKVNGICYNIISSDNRTVSVTYNDYYNFDGYYDLYNFFQNIPEI